MTRHRKANLDTLPPAEVGSSPKGGRPTTAKVLTQQILHFLPNFHESGMTIQEAMFAIEYASNGFNAAAAYRQQYDKRLSDGRAEVRAQTLLRNDAVRQAVVDVVTLWINEKRLRLEREVIASLYAQAFYDPAMFVTPDGCVAFDAWEDIPAEWRCCVEGIEQRRDKAGVPYTTIKLVDRKWALDRLSRLVALAEEGLAQPHGNSKPAQEAKGKDNPLPQLGISNETRARLANIFGFTTIQPAGATGV